MRTHMVTTVCLAISIAMWPTINLAAPRACSPTSGGSLRDGQGGVEVSHGNFRKKGETVPFDVFSLAEFAKNDPNTINEMCLRYELLNKSKNITIEHLRWKDIELEYYGFPIEPGEQHPGWIVTRHDVYPDPGIYSTQVGAYDSSKSQVRALFAQRLKRASVEGDAGAISFFNTANLQRDVVYSLIKTGLHIGSVPGFERPVVPNVLYPVLRKEFRTRELFISSLSQAHFSEGEFIVRTVIRGTVDGDIMAPMLASIPSRVSEAWTDKDVFNFANILRKMITAPITVKDGQYVATTRFPQAALGDLGIFIVRHPITIRTKEGVACIVAQMYSPVPLMADSAYCNLSEDAMRRIQG